ncbi:MAG: hypothetical protein AAFR09_00865, partial [Pseudomonadota bacterium]
MSVAVEPTEASRFLSFLVLPDTESLGDVFGRQRDAALDSDAMAPLLVGGWDDVVLHGGPARKIEAGNLALSGG